ncbi:MAG: hypothetical protein JWM88_3005 [Verrucomicrobia bacterium]|nr:hypothetical protein [Verrucomicrobiota bacterium]
MLQTGLFPIRRRWIFLLALGCAAIFAVSTHHAWEDYYITYRSSRNLATGHGLVYNVGDRLHTFTSPLGVLLPAVARLLTLNTSDVGALWIFRGMSGLAFAGAAVLLFEAARRMRCGPAAALAATAWLCLDAKSVDFTINGMETGFMLLFLAYALWAQFAPTPGRRWIHLGAAWGGLMWTRPDSFIYIGLIAVAAWLFNRPEDSGISRRELIVLLLRAAALCAVIYLPWFLTAWGYYGSPIPHTIVAKSSVSPHTGNLSGAFLALLRFPITVWDGASTIEATFLPSYYMAGGWPSAVVTIARILGSAAALVWLLPFVRSGSRMASFVFFGAHAYLSWFPYFPFPWYVPPTTLLACLALGGLVESAGGSRGFAGAGWRRVLARGAVALAAAFVALQAWTLGATARQVAEFQRIIENHNRRAIGEWLREHARPEDAVFLEPLGYIGYFSGLKTYDWPGLSSREVVNTHRKLGPQWSRIVMSLHPEWLVLRPPEIERMTAEMPDFFSTLYRPVREFDVREEVAHADIHGRPLLAMDARFIVFRRQRMQTMKEDFGRLETRYPGPLLEAKIDNMPMWLVHAPGSLTIKVPVGALSMRIAFALAPDSYAADPKTTGAGFQIEWVDGDRMEILMHRELDPANRPADRPAQVFEGKLPERGTAAAVLILRTLPGESDTKDWTCWARPEFW